MYAKTWFCTNIPTAFLNGMTELPMILLTSVDRSLCTDFTQELTAQGYTVFITADVEAAVVPHTTQANIYGGMEAASIY